MRKPTISGNLTRYPVTRREFIGALGLCALPAISYASQDAGEVNLLAMGDWGAPPKTSDPDDAKALAGYQNRVAARMADYAGKLRTEGKPLTAVLPLGDNFYGSLSGPNDARFTERFENLYPGTALDAPFCFALGNHDYEDASGKNWKHQIAYAAQHPDGRWRFPAAADATWYRLDFPKEKPLVTALVLDTNTDHVKGRWKTQMEWMKRELASTADSRWRIIVAHHPMFTDGYHWDGKKDPSLYPTIRKDILPELDHCVFYLSGHDHNQQHIRHPQYPHLDFLVSGAGGGDFIQKRRNTDVPYQNEFMTEFGFVHLRFTAAEASAQFIAADKTGWSVRHTVTRPAA